MGSGWLLWAALWANPGAFTFCRPQAAPLLTPSGGNYGAPTSSPDGSTLAFGDLLDDKARKNAPSAIHLLDFKRYLSTLSRLLG